MLLVYSKINQIKIKNMSIRKIKDLLIFAQNDMLRMIENAKTQKQAELCINNINDAKFHSGNIHAFDYACKHITNVLEKIDEKNYKIDNWINVNESKPDLGIGVLIFLKGTFTTVGYRKKDGDSYAWQLFGDTQFIIDETDEVTHWQPLPDKPILTIEK